MALRRSAGGTSSPSSSVTDNENAIRLLESLQNDFKCLSMETKKKYPQIKEASEEAIVKLRNSAAVAADHLQQQQQSHHNHHQIYYVVNQILYPVVQGCETKEPKIVKMCLGTIQKLITHRAVDQKGARYITDTLWMLMESGTEHVKVLQSVTLLLTTDCVVRGETLARNLVLCFRLHFTKDSQAVINTAGATVRQLVALVFERVMHEDEQREQLLKDNDNGCDAQQQKNGVESSAPSQDHKQQQSSRTQPLPLLHHHNQYNGSNAGGYEPPVSTLGPCAADAYHMFQDLVRLVNTDRPYWLVGMTEMTRTFGLELLESVLSDFQPVFYKHMEFRYLLKERVCALVIKLFSPNVKHHSGSSSVRRNTISNTGTGASSVSGNNSSSVMMMGVTGGAGSPTSNHRGDDRPHYAITVRLLRLVSILVRKYHKLLITECEIFLSLIVKFLDADKPAWQRSVALEVLHRLVVEPGLLAAFCACYDLKLHSTKIFRDIIDSLAGYVQSLFNPAMVVSGGGSMNNAAMMAATANAALQGQSPAVLAGMPVGPGVSPQPGFFGRGGVWLPVVIQLPTGQAKSIYLEMNDKHDEPPQVADGYGVSVAYACLVDAVRAIQIEVHPDIHQSVVSPPSTTAVSSSVGDDGRSHHRHTDGVSQKNTQEEDDNGNDEQKQTTGVKRSPLHEQIINSSWYGLLTTFCPLIESCTDEGITENMLKAMQAYIGLCGLLDMRGPRDAFITAVCRACLPPHYNLTVFSGTVNTCCVGQPSMSSSSPTVQYATSATMYDDHHHQQYSSATGGGYGPESADYKQQQQVIVAVGTPLATPSSVLQTSSPSGTSLQNHGPVMLTAKNLQCMRALLVLAHCHGSILGSSWHLVLTTLQHLVWILGLKPSTGGSLKAGNSAATSVPNRHSGVTTSATVADVTGVGSLSSSTSSVSTTLSSSNVAVITTAVMAADLPVLSTMLSRLFESSRYLDDVALHHLIDALCKLSHEAMELAYCNREPSLFAVAKLLETGLVNLSRIDILWRPVTNHLLDVCQHPHIRMREWGVEAITYLVKAALQYKYQPPLKDNQKLQTLLLSPLSQLSLNMNGDVRQRQLECVLQVLHGSGQTLSHGWPLVLNIVGAVSDRHGENLIRIAFQCLELVLTDFLPLMPCKCLPLCLETTAKFGMQTRDLNISLTALGLMWNVADYFKDNKDKLLCNNSAGDSSKQRGASGEAVTDSGNTIDSTMSGITDPQELVYPDFPGVTTLAEMSEFDKLWMCLFTKLGELCIDPRPAVRKSAGQTLLSTISAHANLLTPSSWNAVLWQVLFPLMNKVQMLCESASDSTCNTVASSDGTGGTGGGGSGGSGSAGGGTILIHHSRNTDQKQWAETQVSTLYGLARVFNAEKYSMTVGGDFVKAWTLLLEYMEKAALNRNVEVSLAGLRSLHELLMVYSNSNNVGDGTNMTPNDKNAAGMDQLQREEDWQSKNGVSGSTSSAVAPPSPLVENEIWTCTWTVWMRIATAATETTVVESPINPPPTTTTSNGSSTVGAEDRRRREYPLQQHHQSLQHKQKFLTALLQIFPLIFTRIKARFTDKDLNDLFRVLDAAAAVDGSAAVVLSDHHQYYHHQQQLQQQNYYGGSYSQQQLTRLQDEILQCLETLERETLIFDDDEFGGVSTSNAADNAMPSSDSGYPDKKNSMMSMEQQQHRHELVQRFLCPLFDQLLKFCRFVCPPLPPAATNSGGDRQQMTNGAAAVDHFHHHNKFAAAVAVDSNYVAFGEKAVLMIVDLYGMTAAETCVVKGEILRRIIEVFSVPLAGRYSSYPTPAPAFHYHMDVTPLSSGSTQQQQQQHVQQQQQQHLTLVRRRQQQQQNTWKLLVVGLMNVLSVGVPLARDSAGDDYISIWSPLGSVLEDILFPKNLPPASAMLKSNKLVDDNDENDSVIIDCQLVEFLKDEILSQSTNVPREFIMRVVVLLNRGSVLSTTTASTLPNYPYGGGYDTMMMVDCRDGSVSGGVVTGSGVGGFSPPSLLREQFAKVCFETLLQFSLVDGISSSSPPPTDNTANSGSNDSNADAELITGKLAVTALLHRFQEVVEKFCHDQSLTGKCPLPRYRMSEISFVLKAIATLIVSLKKTPDKVSKAVWDQLIRLYPCLVRCVPYTQQCCSSPQVTDSLTEALLQYGDLLLKAPPSTAADAQQP
ncbi:protein MON2 homolog isoform X1 [Acyrthosiphon pisum]|uniref:Protein MON2 homolog n=1 Tax=Acyrthosiphon pisum TaxID=7029 RepID=A0A8R1W640_ACYPI|nr:protein MON2 homolog isoform X1 [Acyrthosiphon pisum]|eukprot:XP_001947417.2 PREDICTED: protein MON2 homolog isoform X1 [Acyrthosiphon pisum]